MQEPHITEQQIIFLADNMAEAATTFAGHGYQQFLQARTDFLDTIHKFVEEHQVLEKHE